MNRSTTRPALLPATLFLIASLASACGGSAPSPDTANSEGQAPTGSEPESSDDSDAPSTLELAKDVAKSTAQSLDGPKAAQAEVVLSLRVRVEGKIAVVQINGVDATVVDGAEVENAADITVDLTPDQAHAIVKGETTLKKLAPEVETDNRDGLDRFVSFLTDGAPTTE